MPPKVQDKNTRYYIDLDLKKRTVLRYDYDQRGKLVAQKPTEPFVHRVFITKGQYNKLAMSFLAFTDQAKR